MHMDAEVRNSRWSQDVHREGRKVLLKTDKAYQWNRSKKPSFFCPSPSRVEGRFREGGRAKEWLRIMISCEGQREMGGLARERVHGICDMRPDCKRAHGLELMRKGFIHRAWYGRIALQSAAGRDDGVRRRG